MVGIWLRCLPACTQRGADIPRIAHAAHMEHPRSKLQYFSVDLHHIVSLIGRVVTLSGRMNGGEQRWSRASLATSAPLHGCPRV